MLIVIIYLFPLGRGRAGTCRATRGTGHFYTRAFPYLIRIRDITMASFKQRVKVYAFTLFPVVTFFFDVGPHLFWFSRTLYNTLFVPKSSINLVKSLFGFKSRLRKKSYGLVNPLNNLQALQTATLKIMCCLLRKFLRHLESVYCFYYSRNIASGNICCRAQLPCQWQGCIF